jgi:hypothetical protein
VDGVRHGSGTTNDGNTARRFFENPDISAEIPGLDVELIHRFAVLLQALSSDWKADPAKFEKYARDTMVRYIYLLNSFSIFAIHFF